jgi:hypothetical protein
MQRGDALSSSFVNFLRLPSSRAESGTVRQDGKQHSFAPSCLSSLQVFLSPRQLSSIFPALFFSSHSQETLLRKAKAGGPKQCYISSHADGVLLLLRRGKGPRKGGKTDCP